VYTTSGAALVEEDFAVDTGDEEGVEVTGDDDLVVAVTGDEEETVGDEDLVVVVTGDEETVGDDDFGGEEAVVVVGEDAVVEP
jgi:hypothetical protein